MIEKVLRWIVGIFCITGFIFLQPFSIANIMLLIAGLIAIPNISNALQEKAPKFTKKKQIISIVVLFFVACTISGAMSTEETSTNYENTIAQTQTAEANNTEVTQNEIQKQKEEEERQKKEEEEKKAAEEAARKAQEAEQARIAEEEAKKQAEAAKSATSSTTTTSSSNKATASSSQKKSSTSTSSSTTTQTTTTQANQSNSRTVYITKTGEKYHRSGCKYLRKSCISTTLSSALAQGYTACSVCNP